MFNNDIIPSVLQLFNESLYLHQWSLRLHKWSSLPHLLQHPPPWKHLNRDLSVSLLTLVSLVFLTESESLFIDTGTCSKPANIISFYRKSMATTCPSRAKRREWGVILQTWNGWLWHALTSVWVNCGVSLTKCCMNHKWINLELSTWRASGANLDWKVTSEIYGYMHMCVCKPVVYGVKLFVLNKEMGILWINSSMLGCKHGKPKPVTSWKQWLTLFPDHSDEQNHQSLICSDP